MHPRCKWLTNLHLSNCSILLGPADHTWTACHLHSNRCPPASLSSQMDCCLYGNRCYPSVSSSLVISMETVLLCLFHHRWTEVSMETSSILLCVYHTYALAITMETVLLCLFHHRTTAVSMRKLAILLCFS